MSESVDFRGYSDETVAFLRHALERQPGAQVPYVPEFVVRHAIEKIERLNTAAENLYHVGVYLWYRYWEAAGMDMMEKGDHFSIHPGISKNHHLQIDPLFDIDHEICREELRRHLWRKVSGDPSGLGQAVRAQDDIIRDLESGLDTNG